MSTRQEKIQEAVRLLEKATGKKVTLVENTTQQEGIDGAISEVQRCNIAFATEKGAMEGGEQALQGILDRSKNEMPNLYGMFPQFFKVAQQGTVSMKRKTNAGEVSVIVPNQFKFAADNNGYYSIDQWKKVMTDWLNKKKATASSEGELQKQKVNNWS